MTEFKQNWDRVLDILRPEMMNASFDSWIAPLMPVSINDEKSIITVAVFSDLAQSIVTGRYVPLLETTISQVFKKKYKLSVIISSDINEIDEQHQVEDYIERKYAIHNNVSDDELYLNPRYNFSTFVVGKNNELAHAAAMAVAEKPSFSYNPLFLYGDAGLGKTHLMHAIGHYVLQNDPKKKVLYVSSEMFTNELINALQKKTIIEFKNKYRSIDILMIDDIQFIENKDATQEEVFHTFNTLYEANKQIILTSDRPPKEMKTLESRLRSRFEWGLIADIQPPDFETRVAILKNKAEMEDITLTNDLNEVFYLIAESITSNIRELEGAFNRVIAHSNLRHLPVTREIAESVLKDVFAFKHKEIDPPLIKKTVCDLFEIEIIEMESAKRTKTITYPRQIAMFLCRELTSLSLPKIGEYFGGRDHTTVIHSCDKISKDIKNNSETAAMIKELTQKIKEN